MKEGFHLDGFLYIVIRSLAPLITTTSYWQEGHDDDDEESSARQFGRGRMDSIPEDDGSSLNSEDRQITSQTLSSDEEVEEQKGSPGWGRSRSTQRWPATPETKKISTNPRLLRRPAPSQIPEDSIPEDDFLSPISEDDIQRKKACLTSILQALSTRFDTVGYCQGMDRIVVHVMRAARCAVSLRSVPLAERPKRDQITEERARQCFSFLEAIFVRLSLSGLNYFSSSHHIIFRYLRERQGIWSSSKNISNDPSS